MAAVKGKLFQAEGQIILIKSGPVQDDVLEVALVVDGLVKLVVAQDQVHGARDHGVFPRQVLKVLAGQG